MDFAPFRLEADPSRHDIAAGRPIDVLAVDGQLHHVIL
jgi:hypothetical protein